MDISFASPEELYNRLKPALRTKQREMARNGYAYIKMEDIWNYLKEIKWKNAHDLYLHEMVSDVLSTYNSEIDIYLKEKLKLTDRQEYFE